MKTRRVGAPIQAVGRTLDTLELLATRVDGISVLELADSLSVEKSIASRLLASLLDRGYVTRDSGNDTYQLSLRLLGVASRYADKIGFPGVCQPTLEDLSQKTNELVQLSVVDGDALVLSAYAQARQQLAILPALGRNTKLHASASGKAWLASLPEDDAAELALRHGLDARTPATITEVGKLLPELAKARRDGYATATGEFTADVNSIAFPIGVKRLSKVIATIAVSAPASRLPVKRFKEVMPLVRDAAAELEAVWPLGALPA
jgi:IclR family transcriptional regulator, acetate operon repressor